MKRNLNNKGFTLTELIIVIVIIGILAGVLIPSLTGYVNKAKQSAAESDGATILSEYLSSLPATEEGYLAKSQLNYVVITDKFYILFERGAFVKSVLIEGDDLPTVDDSADATHYYTLARNGANFTIAGTYNITW